MNISLRAIVGILFLLPAFTGFAQTSSTPAPQTAARANKQLETVKTVTSSSTEDHTFELPLTCDETGNIYMKSRTDGFSAIHKYNLAGERVSSFAASTCPDIKVQIAGGFFVAPDGRVSQVVFSPNDAQSSILVFKDDGSCHSKVKLDTPFSFQPYQLAVLPSGAMLISGLRWSVRDKAYLAYLGLFSAGGTVLKEVDLADESSLEEPAVGKPATLATRDTTKPDPSVTRGDMQLAADGKTYLLRSGSPAEIYAISQGGVVVRRFTIDPAVSGLRPLQIHVDGTRIAVLFQNPGPGSERTLLKVVDLHGNTIAEYEHLVTDGRATLFATFACYSYPGDRFTFLTTSRDNNLVMKIAEPR
jgi:hypothetical protein